MSKKDDAYYFENFKSCAEYACVVARMLQDAFENFDAESLEQRLAEIHEVEHSADKLKHEMMETLTKAFITPIEREDIMQMSQNLDEVIDTIEDALMRLYINCVSTIRPDAAAFTKMIVQCCDALKQAVDEFYDFKRSRTLHHLIVEINQLEEDADKLFIENMHRLHSESSNPLEVIAWREIYTFLELCADSCEHVADLMESVIMKNT